MLLDVNYICNAINNSEIVLSSVTNYLMNYRFYDTGDIVNGSIRVPYLYSDYTDVFFLNDCITFKDNDWHVLVIHVNDYLFIDACINDDTILIRWSHAPDFIESRI